MSILVDCSDVIAQIQHRCRLEGRQPTGEEYDHVIGCLQQVNVYLLQCDNQLAQEKETLEAKCAHLLQDREINQEILLNKHHEVM